MNRRFSRLSPAMRAIDATLRSHELSAALRPHFAKIYWADVVGPQVAGVTQVESTHPAKTPGQHVLVVRVKNGVWANELTLLKGDLIRRLNAALRGQVLSDIHFKASGLSRALQAQPSAIPAPPPPDLSKIILSGDILSGIESTVAAITDDALKAKVRQSLIHAAQADQWKRTNKWAPCAHCGTLTPDTGTVNLCALCKAQGQ